VTIDSVSKPLVGPGDSATSLAWHASENGQFSVRRGGASCTDGTEVASGFYTTAPGQHSTVIQTSDLAEGQNALRLCLTDGAAHSGSDTRSITKDTTAPQVAVDSVSKPLLGPADASTDVTWHANENGPYSVRVGGTDCATGTEVSSGSYSTSPTQHATTVPASALAEGQNTIRVCVTDAASNTGTRCSARPMPQPT
jgi:hypothetical protein